MRRTKQIIIIAYLIILDRHNLMTRFSFTHLFLFASLWNLIGAIFGFFNTAFTFELTFNQALTDPLLFAVYIPMTLQDAEFQLEEKTI